MATQSRIDKIIEKHEELKREKAPWLPLYELIGEYVMTRKQHFSSEVNPGEMQTNLVFDGSAEAANHLMGSSLIGGLWPNGARSVQITPPLGMEDEETDETKKYYERCTNILTEFMDKPRAGFATALEEYMADQGAFGISGIGAFEQDDNEVPVIFNAVDAKAACIDEGPDGFVDTVFIEKQMTIRQAVIEYGYDSLSSVSREAFDKGRGSDKLKILHALEPRVERDPNGFGVKDMPIASIHIELNKKKILRESGYTEMPVAVTRFWKAMGEKYGRSAAMTGLPDILEANALREGVIIATEKQLDPPLYTWSDSLLGNGTIDTSAGAITQFSVSGRLASLGQKPIEQIYTVGELQSSYQRITELRDIIANHFFVDRLLDLNNQTRMTLGETNIRYQLRSESLGTIYFRQIAELFTPIIERTFNILRRKGYFGVIKGSKQELELLKKRIQPYYVPEPIAQRMMSGQEFFKVKFISPAARIMQNEELQGILTTVNTIVSMAPAMPEIVDQLDPDNLSRRIAALTGSPIDILRDTDTIKKIRTARAQAQAAQAQMEAQRSQSETARNVAQIGQMSSNSTSGGGDSNNSSMPMSGAAA